MANLAKEARTRYLEDALHQWRAWSLHGQRAVRNLVELARCQTDGREQVRRWHEELGATNQIIWLQLFQHCTVPIKHRENTRVVIREKRDTT